MSTVPFQPTPRHVVSAMLELAAVSAHDVVYDLGSGDGRILIAAAQMVHARGIGYDIDPRRTNEAWKFARRQGVSGVRFITGDLFDADIRTATVVMLFLWPHTNMTLRPKLRRELQPGARVVSFYWDMGDWSPDRTVTLPDGPLHLWTIPPQPELTDTATAAAARDHRVGLGMTEIRAGAEPPFSRVPARGTT